MDHLSLAHAAVVGQSLGGHTAFLVAARHPFRVSRLVVAEASPNPDPTSVEAARGWLATWPVPFEGRPEALAFFGGEGLRAEAWVNGLETRPDGLHAMFDIERLLAALQDAEARPYWSEWSRISCPTLIVRAEGGLPEDDARRMVESVSHAKVTTISGSGHDVHLDQAVAWREALSAFLG